MKAISPMVAVVLLIAFTVGVGGLVSIFVTGLTTTSTGVTSNQSEALTRCAGAWINVYRVTANGVLYSNPNQQTITGMTIVAGNGTSFSGATSLAPGASTNTSWGGIGDNSLVTVRGLCQTLVTVEGSCRVGQDCWDA